MSNNTDIVFTPAARREQDMRGSARIYEKKIAAGYPDRVTPDLAGFIAELDTAFLATVSAEGAPYIQHRGGPKGFIKVLDDNTLGFADFAGNKQYITISNLAGNDRAYLFLLDRKSTRLNSSHQIISYAVFCLKKKIDYIFKVLKMLIHRSSTHSTTFSGSSRPR